MVVQSVISGAGGGSGCSMLAVVVAVVAPLSRWWLCGCRGRSDVVVLVVVAVLQAVCVGVWKCMCEYVCLCMCGLHRSKMQVYV